MSLNAFQELEVCQNAFAAGTPSRTPLGSLQRSPRLLSWI